MTKTTRNSYNGKRPTVPVVTFISIMEVVDNGDTTYTVNGIVRPPQTVDLQVFDIDGNPVTGMLPGGSATSMSWTITTPAINAALPLCFVAQAGTATSVYVYPGVTVILGPGPVSLRKKKVAKK